MYTELNKEDFKVILDVLNVYDPNDIQHVYPAMGETEFLDGVQDAWKKVLKIVKLQEACGNYDAKVLNGDYDVK